MEELIDSAHVVGCDFQHKEKNIQIDFLDNVAFTVLEVIPYITTGHIISVMPILVQVRLPFRRSSALTLPRTQVKRRYFGNQNGTRYRVFIINTLGETQKQNYGY